MNKLKHFIKSFKFLYLKIFMIRIFFDVPMIALPLINAMLIDNYLALESREIEIFIAVITGLASVVLMSAIMARVESWFVGVMGAKISTGITKIVYKKTQKLRVKEFDTNNAGFFFSRMTDDASTYADFKINLPYTLIGIAITFTSNMGLILWFDWRIGLVGLGISILASYILSLQRKKFKSKFKEVRKRTDIYNTYLANSISGVREIKNFNIQATETEKYNVIAQDFRRSWQAVHKTVGVVMSIFIFVSGMMTLSVMLFGTYNINRGLLTIGGLSAITAYSSKIIEPIGQLMRSLEVFSRGKVSSTRIIDLLEMEEEKTGGTYMDVTAGEIEFKEVVLKYTEDTTALKNINLKIKPGEHIAFVGSTGSGKSTILKALARHYDLTSGEIIVDGIDISTVDTSSLRAGITYISQEGYLSNESIRENIIFGKDIVEDKTYQRALEWSDSRQFIDKSPNGDQSIVGPDGVKLSGGQKQRLTIARGLLKDSKIILFDESTSALDNKTERFIQRNIEEWTKDKTTITVAHRLSTIQNSDRIIVLDKGEIIESGTHFELLSLNGKYTELLKASEEE